ncbi:MAG: heme-binding protein [Comamonadaceae bacterium]|nr:heme-binding protein [Comamonadaceae bacterium]
MKTLFRLSLATACAALLATPAFAQSSALRTERTLTLELAGQIAAKTVATCQANGYAVAVAVVDRGGNLRVLQRADNAGPHTMESAREKAYTAVSAKNNTLAMMEGAQKNPGAANLVHIQGFLLLGGGVPVRAGDEVVGAIGVAGAPGGHLDEQCAVAALDAVKDQLK